MSDAIARKGLTDRIIRASVAVGIANLCFKFVGLIQSIVVGKFLDDAQYDVIYAFAFEGIIWSVFFRLGEETIGPCFLPVFMEQKDNHGEEAAWHLANVVFTVQLILLLAAMLLIMCFPEAIVAMGTYWTQKVDPDKVALARESLVWIAPCLLCLSLGSTTYMILNGYKKFFLAAFGEASWKICVLVFLVVGIGIFKMDYKVLYFGILAGSLAKLLTHLVGLTRQLRYLRFSLDLRHPAFQALFWLMLPMLAGTLFSTFRDYLNNVYVLSSLQTDGLMKANSFGRKLFLAISWMVPYTVGIAMFPFFCELLDRNDKESLGRVITDATRLLCALFIPGAMILAALSEPLAVGLFAGGKFSERTALWAALSNACYVLALPAYSVEYIFMQGYFASRKMVAVLLIGIVFSSLSVGVSYLCVCVWGMRGAEALIAVAAGYSLSRTLKTFALGGLLKRSIPMLPWGETLAFLGRCVAVGLLAGGAVWLLDHAFALHVSHSTGKAVLFARLLLGGAIGSALFFAASAALRLREPFTMLAWTWRKARGRLGR